ncbi:hypothetical protein KAU32_03310 [bacterium]|nr:hypothetical protein [bacterium]
MKLHRRLVYVLLLVFILVPMLFGLTFKVKPTKPVMTFFDSVAELSPGDYIAVTLSFDPSTKAELVPMLKALTEHVFAKGLSVIFLNPGSINVSDLGFSVISDIASKYGTIENSDWYYLGYVPGEKAVYQKLGEDLYSVYPASMHGVKLNSTKLYKDVRNMEDVKILIDLADGNSTVDLLTYLSTKYDVPMAAGVTAVMASEYYPYLESGQLKGLLGGLRGAAEYETLLNVSGRARRGMAAQTLAHILIMLLVLMGNIEYFMAKRKNG